MLTAILCTPPGNEVMNLSLETEFAFTALLMPGSLLNRCWMAIFFLITTRICNLMMNMCLAKVIRTYAGIWMAVMEWCSSFISSVIVLFFFFVELRKQACQLENEIDLKLVSFSKLGTNYRSVHDYSPFQSVAHRSYYKYAQLLLHMFIMSEFYINNWFKKFAVYNQVWSDWV